MNHYDTLGVPKDADQPTIKKAYRRKARKTHPDRAGGDSAAMASLNVAYACLSDETRKARYDATGEDGQGQTPEQEARACALSAFAATIEERGDPVEAAHRLMRDKLRDIAEALAKLDQLTKKLRRRRASVKAPAGANLFHMVIDQKLAEAKAQRTTGEHAQKIVGMAIELLAGYKGTPLDEEDEEDEEEEEPQEMRGADLAAALFEAMGERARASRRRR